MRPPASRPGSEAIGRWTAKDPIGFAGGSAGLYTYVANDPTNGTDATGTISPTIVSGLIGATFAGIQAYRGGADVGGIATAAFGGFLGGLIPGFGFSRLVSNRLAQDVLAGASAAFLGNLIGQVYTPQNACPPSIQLDLKPALVSAVFGAVGAAAGALLPFGATEALPGSLLSPTVSGLADFLAQPNRSGPQLAPAAGRLPAPYR